MDRDIKVKELFRTKVSDENQYNAFCDLVFFEGKYWIAYRTGKGHVSPHGEIIIRNSSDGKQWDKVATIKKEGIDLRDPRISVIDNELLLTCFSLVYWNKIKNKHDISDSYIYKLNKNSSHYDFEKICTFEYEKYHGILWGIVKTHGYYFLSSYCFDDIKSKARIWRSKDLKGSWDLVITLDDSFLEPNLNYNEFDIVLPDKNTMVLFIRVDGNRFNRIKSWWKRLKDRSGKENIPQKKPYNHRGFCDRFVVAKSTYPFEEWNYKVHNLYLKGPRAVYHPQDFYFFIGRYKESRRDSEKNRHIELYKYDINDDSFSSLKRIATGRDGSYAGLLVDPKDESILHVSFYSDHERLSTESEGKINDIWYCRIKFF